MAGDNLLLPSQHGEQPSVVDLEREGSSTPAERAGPAPLSVTNGKYWGTVYRLDGSKIGPTYTISRQKQKQKQKDVDVPALLIVKPIKAPRKSRVFVGKIQPSWRLGRNVRTREIDPLLKPKEILSLCKPRIYVGKRAFLYYKSKQATMELADLSSLSSLEEDWDEETKEQQLQEDEKRAEESSIG